jgi:hypothetical protein
MKTPLILLLLAAPLLADAPSVWTTLDTQAIAMAQAVKDRDIRALHQLDHAINDEVAGLHTPDTGKDLAAALDEIGKEATAAHVDAHSADWTKVAADQAALAKALQTAETLAAKK